MNWLIESTIRSMIFAISVWFGLRVLGVRHVLTQKAVWISVLVLAFGMPLMQGGLFQIHYRSPVAEPLGVAQLYVASVAHTAHTSMSIGKIAHDSAARSYLSRQSLLQAAIAAYGTVCCALLVRLATGLGLAALLWMRARPTVIIMDRRHAVRISSSLDAPVTVGSSIILPCDYTEWSPAKLRMVLAHEQTHVQHGDFYVQLLCSLYCVIFWFSPLGWWLQNQLSNLCEMSADRAGLDVQQSSASYVHLLIEFAACSRGVRRELWTNVGILQGRSFRRRIAALLDSEQFGRGFIFVRRHALATALLIPAMAVGATLSVHAAPHPQSSIYDSEPVGSATPSPEASHATASSPSTTIAQAISGQANAPTQDGSSPKASQVSDPSTDGCVISGNRHYPFSVVSSARTTTTSSHSEGVAFQPDPSQEGKDARISVIRNGRRYIIDDPELVDTALGYYEPLVKLGDQQAELGRRQSALAGHEADGDNSASAAGAAGQEAELGKRQGELGAEQSQLTEEANRKMKALVDGAVRDGKAKLEE
jgi:hypothetical protein